MSKFLKIFTPALGGTVSMLAVAYVMADQFVNDIPSVTGRIVEEAHADTTATPASAPAPAPEVVRVAAREGGFGLGREATEAEVTAWNRDVMPDGRGLPDGAGDVLTGEELFADYCAICHGDFAEGVDNWPKLAGGMDTLDHEDPLKTVGSYWPHLSTAFDYVRRSMPFGNAQTLSDDEVYAIVAYILYSNDLVEEEFVLSRDNFLEVELPNAAGFVLDDREVAEAHFITEPCMENCKDGPVEVTMRAAVLDVTPEETRARRVQELVEATNPKARTAAAPADTAEAPAAVEVASAEQPADTAAAATGGPDPALVAAGETAFKKCAACHQVGEGAKNRSGPHLNGVFGRTAGTVDGFKYSSGMVAAGEEGLVWTDETMAEFLAKPRDYIKKTKMSFNGFKDEEDIRAVSAYLKSVGN